MLLVGSQALSFSETLPKPPQDFDFIATIDDFNTWVSSKNPQSVVPIEGGKKILALIHNCHYECEIAWGGSTALKLLELVKTDPRMRREWGEFIIPNIDILYTIKMSHRFLRNSPHFLKTMNHIHFLRKSGAKIPDRYRKWFKEREKETYNYPHPNLNQPKTGFFDASVAYEYDHDSLHECIGGELGPAYLLFQEEGEEVKSSRKKFEALPEETKLRAVAEECYVLAIERSQVPFPGVLTPKQSFLKALEKVCTSITSGWFREYAWENYKKVEAMYDDTYIDLFKAGLTYGIVRKFTPHSQPSQQG